MLLLVDMTQTLLKRAKASKFIHKPQQFVSKEMVSLALAWVRDEVGIVQINDALGNSKKSVHGAYINLARALKQHLKNKV
jgi:hypothetical protein